jgi:hypothetical protein
MNHADALEVLAVAAAFDRRTVGESDGMAWSVALPNTDMQQAKDAVIQHYTRTDAWVMPSHILAIVAEVNRERERILPPVTPPRDLADEPAREIEWKRIWGDAVIAGHTETKARAIANLRIGVSDDPLLAIGSPEVEQALETFTEAFLKPKPRPTKPPIVRLPARWAADRGLQVLDPDGWRNAGKDWRAPCTEAEFDELLPTCTVGPFQRVTEPVDMPPVSTGTPRDPADVIAEHTKENA